MNKLSFAAFIFFLSFFQVSAQENETSAPVTLADGVDWIYIATCGLYSKWEAEGDSVFNRFGPVGMKPQFGSSADNGTAWSTGTDSANVNKIFFLGPNYSQYQISVFKNKYNDQSLVNYAAIFRLRTKVNPVDTVPVCRISVLLRDTNQNLLGVLDEKIIYSNELGPYYVNFRLFYDYGDFIVPVKGSLEPHQIEPHHKRDSKTGPINNIQKVHFQIEWFGNYELVFDYVEVYDEKMYENYILEPTGYSILVNKINSYNNMFPTESIKYFHSLDEPHSLDGYEAVRLTQHILDSLNIKRDVIREYFPYLSFPAVAGEKNRDNRVSGEAELQRGDIIMKKD